jgi:hypothetical protein
MKKDTVLLALFICGCLLVLPVRAEEYPIPDWVGEESIVEEAYVRKEAPDFEIPPYEGDRYEDSVPDTLDLAEMARLAINGLTEPTDPQNGYEVYFNVNWFCNPPAMFHDFSSHSKAKFMGPLVLNRIISGSDENLYVERKMIELYLRGFDDEGLYHPPVKGRPWNNHTWEMQSSASWHEGKMTKITPEEATRINENEDPYGGGSIQTVHSRLLEAFLIYYLRDNNPMWKDIIHKAVRNGTRDMVDKGDWGYFPGEAPHDAGWLVQALAQCYKVTGDEHARMAAEKLSYFLKDHAELFDDEGRFLGDTKRFNERGRYGGQFHWHANALLGVLEYALAADDKVFKDFVEKSYNWSKSKKAYSSSLVGFFPEFVTPEHPNSEGCPISDMVALSLMLSAGGVGDYWDDADRYVRNAFFESQLSPSYAQRMDQMSETFKKKPIPYHATTDRVTERNIGAFAGWPAPNKWAKHIGIQHCCTGNCARAIYYAWENVFNYKDGTLKINLLLNRASPWADVYSYIPYKGQVDIKTKKAIDTVLVRVPEWITSGSDEVVCTVGGESRKFSWHGRYVNLGKVDKDTTVSVKFPISVRKVKEKMGGDYYGLTIKGNTVISIFPEPEYCPLYQRDHYKEDKVRWHKVNRFVSKEQLTW